MREVASLISQTGIVRCQATRGDARQGDRTVQRCVVPEITNRLVQDAVIGNVGTRFGQVGVEVGQIDEIVVRRIAVAKRAGVLPKLKSEIVSSPLPAM